MIKEEILQHIEDCENRESKMTEWEQCFIQSLSDELDKRDLTSKQINTLEKIWGKIT